MVDAMRAHWPEYLIEAALLGSFMVSACVSVALIEHPASPIRRRVRSALARRGLIGAAMGATAVVLILSPWGARSGAHMNPATTLAFFLLGKVDGADAAWYVVAQSVGGLAGVYACALAMPRVIRHPTVAHVVTTPRSARGASGLAWIAECALAMGMMLTALVLSNWPGHEQLTPYAAGLLLVLFITFEAPISGMSINPARTLASAIPSGTYTGLWIYLTAPVVGMIAAAGLFGASTGPGGAACAKLNHTGAHRCIFRCNLDMNTAEGRTAPTPSTRPERSIDIQQP